MASLSIKSVKAFSIFVGLLISTASAKVCGKEHEDSWDGSCKNGVPNGKGTYTHSSGVSMKSNVICDL